MTISGSGLRPEYRPVRPQERPEPAQEPQCPGPLRTKRGNLCAGATVAAVLYVNNILTYSRCIDSSASPLVPSNRIKTDQYPKLLDLTERGYLEETPSGFEVTDQLVQAIHQKDRKLDLITSLKNAGIDPDPEGFTSKRCDYTPLEFLADIKTGQALRYCPLYRDIIPQRTTCRLSEQEARAKKQNATELQNATEFFA